MHATLNTMPAVQSTNKLLLWTGRVLSALAVLFLIFDAVIKVIVIQPVVDSFVQLGLPVAIAPQIGWLALSCLVIYLIPRTAVMGAVLLTGYLGGALSLQVRIDAPLFSLLFPLILGAMLWGGLYLRDRRVRALVK